MSYTLYFIPVILLLLSFISHTLRHIDIESLKRLSLSDLLSIIFVVIIMCIPYLNLILVLLNISDILGDIKYLIMKLDDISIWEKKEESNNSSN
jgi:hypothetical protein